MLNGTMYRILVLFNNKDTWTFTDLCKHAGFSPDLGAYYIRQLVSQGYLANIARGRYAITSVGGLYLSRARDRQNPLPMPQPRVIAVLVGRQGTQGILLRRGIQPHIDTLEWPGGTVLQGEDLPSAAHRLCSRYFTKVYPVEFAGFFRKIECVAGEVFDDKLLAVHTVQIPIHDKFTPENEIGVLERYAWSRIPDTPHAPKNLLDLHEFASMSGPRPYIERVYQLLPD